MYYCDGTSFSGDLEAPVPTAGGKYPNPIYFRGRWVKIAFLTRPSALVAGNHLRFDLCSVLFSFGISSPWQGAFSTPTSQI
jgi:hypothetical protein